MPTDLTKVQDRPATVLRDEATRHSITGSIYVTGAEVLDAYEEANEVTFAALDNDALSDVREAYSKAADAAPGQPQYLALLGLLSALPGLLGLDD